MLSVDRINALIGCVEGITLIEKFSENEDGLIIGKISVNISHLKSPLLWDVQILKTYPFKILGHESIQFINKSLLDYPHIMEGGNLCIHTPEYENAESQFIHDLDQLKEWVEKYYINEEKDNHYEHIVVNYLPIREKYYTFCFAETEFNFEDNDYGIVLFSKLFDGVKKNLPVKNFIVHKFCSEKSNQKENENKCKISSAYSTHQLYEGVYFFLNEIPCEHNKFIIQEYDKLKWLFSQYQKDFIHKFVITHNNEVGFFPLFCGYKIPNGEIHWQVIILFMDDLPIKPFHLGTGRNREWHTDWCSGKIPWAQTENISYKYFFGRGCLPSYVANMKVLIMGIGAIGSIVAETLTRNGAKNITLHDIDLKEPGNICRSTYSFFTGITEKTIELAQRLIQISPHLQCECHIDKLDLALKAYANDNKNKQILTTFFNEYDLIFDCTTDNQLMRLIDSSRTKAQIVNLWITNHAKELVCVFSPNITETVKTISTFLNPQNDTDLYNPTGCWNPTFKATYNEIGNKVQFALKYILKMINKEIPKSSFYLTDQDFNLKLNKI